MFSSSVPHITLTYRIDSDLIAIGNTNWQTKNITSISIDQHQLKLSELEPKFIDPKPVSKTSWGLVLLAIATSWTVAINTNHPAVVGWLFTCAVVFGAWFVRHYGHKNNLRIWVQRRDHVARQQAVWKRLASSVPTIFNLILESSSGKAVALSTFDRNSLLIVHNTILEAMRGSSGPAATGSIRTIDASREPVEKLYEIFCRGEIESA